MSKAAAIHIAISVQIASEDKDMPHLNGHLGTVNNVAGPYDNNTIRGFLANVASRLRADTPPLLFNWSGLNEARCLNDKLWVVEQDIAAATTAVPPPEPKDVAKS